MNNRYKLIIIVILVLIIASGTLQIVSAKTINNATTTGWTTINITLNGTRFTGDGLLALHLNSSYIDGLVGYWSMDETIGTKLRNVNNESGLINTTNEGTFNGNTTLNYTSGKIGNAGRFDDVNDYVDAGNDPSLNLTSNITISAWINVSSTHIVPSVDAIATKFAALQGYDLILNSGKIRFAVRGTSTIDSNPQGSLLNDSTWHHVVGVGNTTAVKVYVDGVQKGSTATGTWTATTTSNSFQIGRRSAAGTEFNGSIDEVMIWNRTLSASEISVLYNTSFRTRSNVTIWNQNATYGYVVNRTRLNFTNYSVLNHTIDILTKPNSTSTWNLTAINISNYTWYNIDSGNQSSSEDFTVQMNGNGSYTSFFEYLEWDETPGTFTLSGYVNNTLGASVDGAKVEVGGYSTYTRTTPLLNTTDLGDYGTGERIHGITYYNNQTDVDVFLIFHVIGSGSSKHVDTNVTLDNGIVLDRDFNTTAGSGVHEHFSYYFTAPKGIGYKITNNSFVSQLEWREAPHVSGYYKFVNIPPGITYINSSAIGYRNATNTTTINSDIVLNFTLQGRTSGTVTAPSLNITAVIFIFIIVFYIHRIRRTS